MLSRLLVPDLPGEAGIESLGDGTGALAREPFSLPADAENYFITIQLFACRASFYESNAGKKCDGIRKLIIFASRQFRQGCAIRHVRIPLYKTYSIGADRF